MGMYTELDVAFELDKNIPEKPLEVLKDIFGFEDNPEFDFDAYPDFFKCIWSAGSYYFEGRSHRAIWYDGITETWHVQVKTNCKNYGYEIERFLTWLRPYLADFVDESRRATTHDAIYYRVAGYIRYEEELWPQVVTTDGWIVRLGQPKLKFIQPEAVL